MNKIKMWWEWLVKSSVDADKWSLTVKAFLTGIIPMVVLFSNLTNVQLGSEQLTQIVDLIAQVVAYVGTAVTSIIFFVGLIRKIVLTIQGTNDVIAKYGGYDN